MNMRRFLRRLRFESRTVRQQDFEERKRIRRIIDAEFTRWVPFTPAHWRGVMEIVADECSGVSP